MSAGCEDCTSCETCGRRWCRAWETVPEGATEAGVCADCWATDGPAEPDDLMALADAVGVTTKVVLHPATARYLSDVNLDAVLSKWTREHSSTAWPMCTACGGHGLLHIRSLTTGATHTVTCHVCGGHR